MKKLYTLVSLSLLLMGGKTFSQTFIYINNTFLVDSTMGSPSCELVFSSTLYNNTANAIPLRVTRQQNVMPEAPTWTSAFCMDVCYLPTTDSVNYNFQPMDTVNFTFHMYTSSTPDHATAKMRWKNTGTPANTFNQDFTGVTDGTSGVNEFSYNSANVSIYPMPIFSGEIFTLGISNVQSKNKNISVSIYDIFGNLVKTTSAIEGINFMNLDLAAGVYSYSLVSENSVINSGKIAVVK